MYNENILCQKCGKNLSDNEIVRIGRDKTLRYCDECWQWALIEFQKIKPLWKL